MSEVRERAVFEPRILAFLCNWCSYAGADLAGVSRIQYPPNTRHIRVMCTGRIDPVFVMRALKDGVDGVLLAGCHPGDCHYLTGNYQAKRRFEALEVLLALTGIGRGRLRLEWVSASEGRLFGEVITDFTERIRAVGPSPVNDPSRREAILANLEAAHGVVADFRFRGFVGKEEEVTEVANVYSKKIPADEYQDLLERAIEEEYLGSRILVMTRGREASVREMAEAMGLEPSRVLRLVSSLRKRNLLGLSRLDETTPYYINISVAGGDH